MANKKLLGTFISTNFSELLDILTDLYKINKNAKLKISNDEFLLYATEGVDNNIHALKTYMLKTTDFFLFKTELDSEVSMIIDDIKKLIEYLKFVDITKKIGFQFILDKDNRILLMKISDGIFSYSEGSAKGSKIRDLSKKQIDTLLDVDNSSFKFDIPSANITSIKKLAKLNIENEILNISIKDGIIKFYEPDRWNLEVGNTTSTDNIDLAINKKYFYSIIPTIDIIELYVYEHFILFKEINKNLMICFEKTV